MRVSQSGHLQNISSRQIFLSVRRSEYRYAVSVRVNRPAGSQQHRDAVVHIYGAKRRIPEASVAVNNITKYK
jgi:hypothetical protein